MDAEAFLAYLVPKGNYRVISFEKVDQDTLAKGVKGKFVNRHFEINDLTGAARAAMNADKARPANAKYPDPKLSYETYFALSSFKFKTQVTAKDGSTYERVERTKENAHYTRAFWIDFDVKRPGDGKDPGECYATTADAMTWLGNFCVATGLPKPNVFMSSGYGIHVYWVVEDAIDSSAWLLQGGALKVAMADHKFTGDVGVSGDPARVLRLPGTHNWKDRANPKLVKLLVPKPPQRIIPIPNAQILGPLAAFLGRVPKSASKSSPTVGQAAQATAPSPLAGGAAPAALQGQGAGMTQAAQQMPAQKFSTVPRHFANVAQGCAQIARSLAEHGANDHRDIWEANLGIAVHCVDGVNYVHPISDGHPQYTYADTDKEYTYSVGRMPPHGKVGPALCKTYNGVHGINLGRPGICPNCVHWGKIATPLELGASPTATIPSTADMPYGFRHDNGWIEHGEKAKDLIIWHPVFQGDIDDAILVPWQAGGWALNFNYLGPLTTHRVTIPEVELDPRGVRNVAARAGITIADSAEPRFKRLVVDYIQKLKAAQRIRSYVVPAFGWVKDDQGAHAGFAIGGKVIKPDGSTYQVAGGDPVINGYYTPKGDPQMWRPIAERVMAGRPDLATIIAVAFAAPLIPFSGVHSVIMSFYSQASGVGKSSASDVGNAVWGSRGARISTNATMNAMSKKISSATNMPGYMDEFRMNDKDIQYINYFRALTQGSDRERLDQHANLTAVRELDTILNVTSNVRLQDILETDDNDAEANAVRVLEFEITHPTLPYDRDISMKIKELESNYGWSGFEYAKYLSMHIDEVKATIVYVDAKISAQLSSTGLDRFYMSAITCVLAGAILAGKAQVVTFNIPAIMTYMVDGIKASRTTRTDAVEVAVSTANQMTLLSAFVNAHSDRKIVTDRFQPAGNSPPIKILSNPLGTKSIVVHISEQEHKIRIDRHALTTWIKTNHYGSSAEFMRYARVEWKAHFTKARLGAQHTATFKMNIIEIALDGELEELRAPDGDLTSGVSSASAPNVPRATASQGAAQSQIGARLAAGQAAMNQGATAAQAAATVVPP